MRLLTLSWEYPPRIVGGLARHVEELSQAQAEQGLEVHVVTAPHPEAPADEIAEGVHVHRVKPAAVAGPDFLTDILQLNMRLMSRAFALHQEHPFDMIHAHDWLVAHAAIGLKEALGLPMAVTIHATEGGRNHGIHNPLQSYIHQMEWSANYESWRTIVCSEAMRQNLMRDFAVPADKLDVIPNGIKASKFEGDFDAESFRKRFADPGQPLIMTVGRMVHEKGMSVLLEAIPALLTLHPNAHVVFCGKGPELEKYRARASELGLWGNVTFTGYIDDTSLYRLYRVADAAVFPSLYEPFGIVALEGMAAGLPTIVSETGGFAEIVDDGVNGLKVPPGDQGALAWALHRVLSSPEWGRSLGAAGKAATEDQYDWARIARATEQVYLRIMNEAKPEALTAR